MVYGKVAKMLNVGIIGLGFMGRMHYRCWKEADNVKIVAICDANPDNLKNSDNLAGNIEGANDEIDFDGIEQDRTGYLRSRSFFDQRENNRPDHRR